MRQRVIAQRTGTRRSVQIIVGSVLVFVLGMAIFNRGFVAPYGTALGEAVLALVLALFGLGFWWLRRLAKVESPGRFLLKPMPTDQPQGQLNARRSGDGLAGGAQMIIQIVLGTFCGFGIFAIIRGLIPSRPGAAARVAWIDALRASGQFGTPTPSSNSLRGRLGWQIAQFYARWGWEQRSTRADLKLLERPWQQFLVTKVSLGVAGFLVGPLLFGAAWLLGLHLTPLIPIWAALAFAGLFFMLPDLEVRREAAAKRDDFRRVVAAYLDLVSMNLAGGRGLPEALMSASEVSDGWALRRVRDCLTDARLSGVPQWTALGDLGTELGVKELTDLGAALNLVADDGAKVRASLASRAETMRRREIAEMEGKAGARSQSMLVAQMLLCAGFLLFLLYPATVRIFQLR